MPAVLEEGEEAIELKPGEWALEIRSGRLWIEVWQTNRSLSRRIVSVERHETGILDCVISRFAGTEGRLSFLDLRKPQTAHRQLAGARQTFAEQFRRMLYRQFPGWEMKAFSSSMDLQRSFSPVFPRARLVRGQHQIATLACPTADDERPLLTFALVWFDHIRQTSPAGMRTTLALFLPQGCGALTAHRLHWMESAVLPARLFLFNEHGSAGEVDGADLGNLDTRVSAAATAAPLDPPLRELLQRFCTHPNVGICPELSGHISLRHRGREWARVEAGRLLLGLEDKQPLAPERWAEAETFLTSLAGLTEAGKTPFLPAANERWLETAVRRDIVAIDATLRPTPIHGQVITFAGMDRDALDLLAISSDGRLAVLELKTAEDIHLPIQGLDYWMRVVFHVQRGETAHLFPGLPVSDHLPCLRFVAPALSFHSTHATVLRYFSREVDVERIGIHPDWSERLKVVLRLRGGELPQSHGAMNDCPEPLRHKESNLKPKS